MSFVFAKYLPLVVLATSLLALIILRNTSNFMRWIETHWFYKTSKMFKFSQLSYILALALILLALLDLRGPEQLVQSKTINQKTLILVDTSASMYAEDVRPNRFEKAILLVKHFVKKAVGQKISVAVFSDNHKVIVPFTDDVDLVDARVESLKELNLRSGGTALSLSVQEAIQQFKVNGEEPVGNILIFTDAEETDYAIDLEIPKTISVGVVGVGTRKGAPVPTRNARGVFVGNKKFQGKLVISKLDENEIKKFGEKIKHFKYWVATSYTLPTEEILQFFKRSHEVKMSENSFKIRPVKAYLLLVPAFILLLLAYSLRLRKPFVVTNLLLLFVAMNTFASPLGMPITGSEIENQEKKEPVKSKETLSLEKLFMQGKLGQDGKEYLATKLLEDGFPEDANKLYDELAPKGQRISDKKVKHQFNHASAMLESKKTMQAINKYKDILDHLEQSQLPEEEKKKIEAKAKLNILRALSAAGGGGKKDSDNKDQKDQQQKDGKGKSGDKNQDKKQQKENQGKDKNKKPNQDMKRNDNDSQNENKEQRQARKKKLPALLKQLMSDDNKLQKKMIDAKTTKRKGSDQKDW